MLTLTPLNLTILSALAILLPLTVAIIAAFLPSHRPNSVRDYFLFEKKLTADEFATSSVGYSSQVASIYLFIYWFSLYGMNALIVPAAWGIGYLLLDLAIRKREQFRQFLGSTENVETIHGFVAGKIPSSGKAKSLLLLAAISTLIGLCGTMIAEVDYAVKFFIMPSLGITVSTTTSIYYVLHAVFLLFSGFYVLWGGYRAVVKTDSFQVWLAYLALGIVVWGSAYLAWNKGHSFLALFVCFFAAAFYAVCAYSRRQLNKTSTSELSSFWQTGSFIVLSTSSVIVFVYLFFSQSAVLSGTAPSVRPPDNGLFFGFGALGAISLIITNMLWQFIDISSLQRLQAVAANSPADFEKLSRGLRASALESAGIWVLIILLAFVAQAGGTISSGNLLIGSGTIIQPIFIFIVTAFMMSTIDCLVSAASFVCYYDIVGSRKTEDNENSLKSLAVPRIVTLCFLLAVYLIYISLSKNMDSTNFAAILYAFYAIQASIVAVVLDVLMRGKVSSIAGIISIPSGWLAATISATHDYSVIFNVAIDSWYVMPPLLAIAASLITYWLVCGIEKIVRGRNI